MKKIILVPALIGVMGIGGIIAVAGGNIIGSADSSERLSVSEIQKKALQEVNGKIKEIEFEKEGSKSYYEVEVVTDDFEYDLKYDAFTGELLKKKKDDRDDDDDRLSKQSTTQMLSTSDIEKKALAVVNGKIVEIDFDRDDNRSYYDVEIIANNKEYELKFDAYTGELLEKEIDDRDDDDRKPSKQATQQAPVTSQNHNTSNTVETKQQPVQQPVTETKQPVATPKQPTTETKQPATTQPTTTAPQMLSVSDIKQKALAIANGKIVEIELDRDDNRSYYEIEIITNNAEYELKFDAYTGVLLEKEVDNRDDDEWDD